MRTQIERVSAEHSAAYEDHKKANGAALQSMDGKIWLGHINSFEDAASEAQAVLYE